MSLSDEQIEALWDKIATLNETQVECLDLAYGGQTVSYEQLESLVNSITKPRFKFLHEYEIISDGTDLIGKPCGHLFKVFAKDFGDAEKIANSQRRIVGNEGQGDVVSISLKRKNVKRTGGL